jgi:peptidoglycan/LPS O-acetylase OafA/YrhL
VRIAKLFSARPTIGDLLDANGGVGPGFDFVRIALAFSIVLAHSLQIATGAERAYGNPLWIGVYLQVPMFFALSGFLVAGSASRLSLGRFLVNRALRIYPALITEIGLSIFLIGLTFTTVSYAEFFADRRFWLYLTNLFGFPHFALPGVFETNPLHGQVNNALWTVPYELACYAIMTFLISTGVIRDRRKLLLFTACVIVFAASPVVSALLHDAALNSRSDLAAYLYENLIKSTHLKLYAYFCCGVTAYQFRDRIPYSRLAFGACLAALAALSFADHSVMDAAWFRIVALPLGVYVTVFLGMTKLPLPGFLKSGDYSYGVYLYGFPVQQAVQTLTGSTSVWVNFALASPLIYLWSRFSWAFVEKPALSLRNRIFAKPKSPAPAAVGFEGEPELRRV